MERVATLVAYDIADPKRLRRVFEICRGFGDHLQLSVFRADLTPRARAELVAALDAVINHTEDQVLLVAIGPTEGTRVSKAFAALGRSYTHPEFHAVVL
jgi:CRISPR-associated protein Cas2